MRGRYENHLKAYRQASGLATATGFSITEQDQKKGIDTLEKNQESLCIFFKRIYDLFERRYTVTPAFTVELGSLAGVKAVARAPSSTGSEGNEQVVPNSCPGTPVHEGEPQFPGSNEQVEAYTAKENSEPQASAPEHGDADSVQRFRS
ncbi:hypothetical protein PsorP6_017391 [Peronosclerospora sorghi]|uniref:Uncharacterized protein n=1 Tax=Peronosclerospora sorghi TaxID=230839 RepID=A0ACC0WN54_9STRA|nr:hypothetical protein PsorP6_017391 [Peronosclerospora sorghi]